MHFYYAGAVIILALMIGGGTGQGLWSDHLLQLLLLPAVFLGLGNLPATRITTTAKIVVVVLLILVAVQFLPISRNWPGTPQVESIASRLFSPAPGRSLESALVLVTSLGFAAYLTRFSDLDQERLLRFLLIGMVINIAVGAMQLSFSGNAQIEGVLPYTMRAATFANENHFSTMVFAMVPLTAYFYLVRVRQPFAYLVVVAILVFYLFAVNSRAGMAISLGLTFWCLFWFAVQKNQPRKLLMASIAVFTITAVAGAISTGILNLDGDLRKVFFSNTWTAAKDHWLTGSGLGTFVLVYPMYETSDQITNVYANHAHNDYLELLLETGILGILIVVAYVLMVLSGMYRSKLAQAAALAIFAILLHSLVDYPLRTMSMAIMLAYLTAIVLSARPYEDMSGTEPATAARALKQAEPPAWAEELPSATAPRLDNR